jgi:hypothetical protein
VQQLTNSYVAGSRALDALVTFGKKRRMSVTGRPGSALAIRLGIDSDMTTVEACVFE